MGWGASLSFPYRFIMATFLACWKCCIHIYAGVGAMSYQVCTGDMAASPWRAHLRKGAWDSSVGGIL